MGWNEKNEIASCSKPTKFYFKNSKFYFKNWTNQQCFFYADFTWG